MANEKFSRIFTGTKQKEKIKEIIKMKKLHSLID
jgi:hypothetical protein